MKTVQVMIPWYASAGIARDVYDVWVIQKNRQEGQKFRWC